MNNVKQWLEVHAEKVPSDLSDSMMWVTKARGDYLTLEGMEDKLEYITDLVNVSSTWEAGKPVNIGYNPTSNKWYGWSHRAMYGFSIGSECKKGDCHYRPIDKDDFLSDCIRFWSEADHLNVTGEHQGDGVYVEWEVSQCVPNEKMRGKITGIHSRYPDEYGRGEWVAETLEDARQMAIDFANDVA